MVRARVPETRSHSPRRRDFQVFIDVQDEHGNTLLLLAAQQGNKKIVKALLRRGANIHVQNQQGNSVLHYCFTYSFESLGEYFISKGADDSLVNAAGEYNQQRRFDMFDFLFTLKLGSNVSPNFHSCIFPNTRRT